MEWWASEIAILMAGVADGAIGLSTLALYQTTNSTMFMFSMGYQVSGATRVGQNLGSGRPKTARRAAMMGPSLALLTSCVLAVILLTFRNEIPYLFTGSDGPGQRELAIRVAATYGYLSLYVVGDGVSNSFGGVIQGSGKQSYGAVVVIVSYFVIALPICYFAGLQGGGGYMSIVMGMTVGTCIQCCGNGLIVLLTNYEAESALAAGRAQKQQYEVLQTEKPAELGGGVVVSSLQDHRESDALEMGAMVKVAGLGGGEGSEF
mmetsp:Transcript_98200/g.281065  ORF Transcript_98200/g.281065 Transcript_98200/m.281065 type:complete len:262 (+) Transcript_98200:1-786(+)